MRRRRRVPRILLNAATALSSVLFVATATLWAAAHAGRVCLIRLAPADGRVWSFRSTPGQDANHFVLITVAPCEHAPATGWAWGPAPTAWIPGRGFLLETLGGRYAPPLARDEWHWAGVTAVHRQSDIYSRSSPISPMRSPDNRAPLWTWTITVPYAWPIAVLALPPLAWLFRARLERRRRRSLAGHCPHCNYDLRATPTRCPECGAVPPPPSLT
jgi:hypothetical protein